MESIVALQEKIVVMIENMRAEIIDSVRIMSDEDIIDLYGDIFQLFSIETITKINRLLAEEEQMLKEKKQ